MEAETRGVQSVIEWIEDMNLQNVEFECDSDLVVKAIKNEAPYYLEIGHTPDVCGIKLGNRIDLSLCHVRKQENQVAHLIARAPCLINCYSMFLSPLSILLKMLRSDLFLMKSFITPCLINLSTLCIMKSLQVNYKYEPLSLNKLTLVQDL